MQTSQENSVQMIKSVSFLRTQLICFFHMIGSQNGEGNSNPLQYSCLENPLDGGAWWATVHGVAKSRT